MEEVVDQIAADHLENVKVKAEFVAASCPFHGEDRHPSFWIERSTGRWGCFTCSVGGSGIEWLLKELKVPTRSIEWAIEEAKKDRHRVAAIAEIQRRKKAKADFTGLHTLPESILGIWDYCPLALLESGFSEEILRKHDVGYDQKRNRITFPIRDIAGNLVGVSGRSVDGRWPKYKVYQGYHNQRDDDGNIVRDPGELGAWFPEYSSTDIRNHLYRGNFVYQKCFDDESDYLIIVEGYKAALWLVQLGYECVVALMGSRMSQTQERLVRRMGVPTYVLLDNNDAGQDGADSICDRLGNCTFPVYRCWYPEDMGTEAQPDDLETNELVEEILGDASRAVSKLRKRRRKQWA